jgi:hypothetical protein
MILEFLKPIEDKIIYENNKCPNFSIWHEDFIEFFENLDTTITLKNKLDGIISTCPILFIMQQYNFSLLLSKDDKTNNKLILTVIALAISNDLIEPDKFLEFLLDMHKNKHYLSLIDCVEFEEDQYLSILKSFSELDTFSTGQLNFNHLYDKYPLETFLDVYSMLLESNPRENCSLIMNSWRLNKLMIQKEHNTNEAQRILDIKLTCMMYR